MSVPDPILAKYRSLFGKLCQLVPQASKHCDATGAAAAAQVGVAPFRLVILCTTRRLPKFAPNREFIGINARTFQSISIASSCGRRKTPSQPLEIGSRARKPRTLALVVAFRRARFEIHTFVDGGARPWGGVATALEPKARTQTRISTSG